MKKVLLLVLVAVLAVTVPAFAGISNTTTTRGQYVTPHQGFTDYINTNNKFYHTHDLLTESKLDAKVFVAVPYAVKIVKDVYFGVEGGKDIVDTSAKQGWYAKAGITCTKTFFDIPKFFGKK